MPGVQHEPASAYVSRSALAGRTICVGQTELIWTERPEFGVVMEPVGPIERDFLHEDLLSTKHREQFYSWVDHFGFVLCRNLQSTHETYRFVRGRSSPGKLSPGEYSHHDGCSGPVKPRIVEIRFPYQTVERRIATAIAPFPEIVSAMFACLPEDMRADILPPNGSQPFRESERTQAMIMRAARRQFSAVDAREYLRAVDLHVKSYVHRWQWGDSLFVANSNAQKTFQHRRAYVEPAFNGQPSGNLVKRWPAEELEGIPVSCAVE